MSPILILLLLGLSLICLIAEWTASSEQAHICATCGYCKAKQQEAERKANRPTRCYMCRLPIPPEGICRKCKTKYWEN